MITLPIRLAPISRSWRMKPICAVLNEPGWPLATFLDRARLTQSEKITRTTLLLLGKPESAYLLSPHPAQMSWKLEGPERAYEHFGPPFLLTTSALYQRIRNIQLRIFPDDALLLDKLGSVLDDAAQKKSKIGNLISKLRMDGAIYNAGSKGSPEWKRSR